MTALQAAAALVLCRSGRFDTYDIAKALGGGIAEADICRLLDAVRDRERGPDIRLVREDVR